MNFKPIIESLIKQNKTISTMESCTGGAVASAITNIERASLVLKFSAVTYSNEFKIKMGVDKNIIDKYTVYSKETAIEMSKNISKFTNSNYGIGITGKLNSQDEANPTKDNDIVYISIYNKDLDKYFNYNIKVKKQSRELNKRYIIEFIIKKLEKIINR